MKEWRSRDDLILGPPVNETALNGLERAKVPGHAKPLLDALIATLKDMHEAVRVRWAAVWALERIGDASAVSALIAALKDVYKEVRMWAAWALDDISEREGVRILPDGRVERVE